jgi:hypothetical protein
MMGTCNGVCRVGVSHTKLHWPTAVIIKLTVSRICGSEPQTPNSPTSGVAAVACMVCV